MHTETWATLPKEVRPLTIDGRDLWRFKGLVDPVVLLVEALYGHPDAGTHWEMHVNEHLREI